MPDELPPEDVNALGAWLLNHNYMRRIFGFCRAHVHDRHVAEDVSQNTFCRVIESYHTFDRTKRFDSWLLTIAGHECANYYRKNRRAGTQLPENWNGPAPVGDDSVWELVIMSDAFETLLNKRSSLHPQQRSVLDGLLADKTQAEMAEAMGVSQPRVSQIYRSLVDSLRDML